MQNAAYEHFSQRLGNFPDRPPDDFGLLAAYILDVLQKDQPQWEQASRRQTTIRSLRYKIFYDWLRGLWGENKKDTQAAINAYVAEKERKTADGKPKKSVAGSGQESSNERKIFTVAKESSQKKKCEPQLSSKQHPMELRNGPSLKSSTLSDRSEEEQTYEPSRANPVKRPRRGKEAPNETPFKLWTSQ